MAHHYRVCVVQGSDDNTHLGATKGYQLSKEHRHDVGRKIVGSVINIKIES